jgi:transcriptional regulator with XRE-family HTH domain
MTERPELANFLRARREALRPADVGLPDSGRRRTPGLRREEVATLAGVSVDYLIRLEQGRDTHPSSGVLAALAQALRLTDDEKGHLAKLALRERNAELCPGLSPLHGQVAPTVQQVLDALETSPALVLGPANHVLAWNRAWEQLVRPLGMLDAPAPNLARYVFAHPKARTAFPDWSAVAVEQAGHLRAAEPRWGDDDEFAALLDELRSVPEFAALPPAHTVTDQRRGITRLCHPEVGELRIAYEVLALADAEQRLVTWLPADDATAASLRALGAAGAVSPPRLRVVGTE